MISNAPTLTNAGEALLMRAIAGETITFTKFKAGDGSLSPGTQIKTLTDLISTVIPFDITKVDDSQPGSIQISGAFDSSEITEAFYWRELGIFAKGEDGTEILYAYANDGEDAGIIRPIETEVQTKQSVTMIVAIGEAEHVTVVISPTQEYQTPYKSASVTIAAADWSGGTSCIKTVQGVKANNLVQVTPAPGYLIPWGKFGVYASAQSVNQLTFTAIRTPSEPITVNVVVWG